MSSHRPATDSETNLAEDLIRKKFFDAALHELKMRRNGEEIDALAARAYKLVEPELAGLKKGFDTCVEEYAGTVGARLTLGPVVVEKCDYEKGPRGAKNRAIRLEVKSGGVSSTAEFNLIAVACEKQERGAWVDGKPSDVTIMAFSFFFTDENRNVLAESRGWAESIFDSAKKDADFEGFFSKVAGAIFEKYKGYCENGPVFKDQTEKNLSGKPRPAPQV